MWYYVVFGIFGGSRIDFGGGGEGNYYDLPLNLRFFILIIMLICFDWIFFARIESQPMSALERMELSAASSHNGWFTKQPEWQKHEKDERIESS